MKTNFAMSKIIVFLVISSMFGSVNAIEKREKIKKREKREKRQVSIPSKTDIFNMSERVKESFLNRVFVGDETSYDDAFTNVNQTENYIDRVMDNSKNLDESALKALIYDAKILSELIVKNYDVAVDYAEFFLNKRIIQVFLDSNIILTDSFKNNFGIASIELFCILKNYKTVFDSSIIYTRLCKILLKNVNLDERQDIRDMLDSILIDYVNMYLYKKGKIFEKEELNKKFEKIVLDVFIPYLKKYNNLVLYPLKNEI